MSLNNQNPLPSGNGDPATLFTHFESSEKENRKVEYKNTSSLRTTKSEKFEIVNSKRISSNVLEKIENLRHSKIPIAHEKEAEILISELSLQNHTKTLIYQSEEINETALEVEKFEITDTQHSNKTTEAMEKTEIHKNNFNSVIKEIESTREHLSDINVLEEKGEVLRPDLRTQIVSQIESTYPNPPPPGLQYPELPLIVTNAPESDNPNINKAAETKKEEHVEVKKKEELYETETITKIVSHSDNVNIESIHNTESEKVHSREINEIVSGILFKYDQNEKLINHNESQKIEEVTSEEVKKEEVKDEEVKNEDVEIAVSDQINVEILNNQEENGTTEEILSKGQEIAESIEEVIQEAEIIVSAQSRTETKESEELVENVSYEEIKTEVSPVLKDSTVLINPEVNIESKFKEEITTENTNDKADKSGIKNVKPKLTIDLASNDEDISLESSDENEKTRTKNVHTTLLEELKSKIIEIDAEDSTKVQKSTVEHIKPELTITDSNSNEDEILSNKVNNPKIEDVIADEDSDKILKEITKSERENPFQKDIETNSNDVVVDQPKSTNGPSKAINGNSKHSEPAKKTKKICFCC